MTVYRLSTLASTTTEKTCKIIQAEQQYSEWENAIRMASSDSLIKLVHSVSRYRAKHYNHVPIGYNIGIPIKSRHTYICRWVYRMYEKRIRYHNLFGLEREVGVKRRVSSLADIQFRILQPHQSFRNLIIIIDTRGNSPRMKNLSSDWLMTHKCDVRIINAISTLFAIGYTFISEYIYCPVCFASANNYMCPSRDDCGCVIAYYHKLAT